MIRTQVSLEKDEYQLAKVEAKRRHISFAAFLREALRTVLPKPTEKPWMTFAGFVESGDSKSSRRIDEVVYDHKD